MIDAHHHLWLYNTVDYDWMDDSMAVLKRDYLPSDLEHELDKTGVEGTVVVQARQRIEETQWLLEQADKNPWIKGVVGWVDLQSADLKGQLEAFANHPKLVGVRHVIHDEPDDDFMLKPQFLSGLEQLGAYNLVYDLLLFPKHLKRAVEVVQRFPEQRFALDHMAKPSIKSEVLDPWQTDIERLASHSNVWCKISGMVTEADLESWTYADFVPYMEVVLNAFGTNRLMLGSDWPVCRLAGEYQEVMQIPLRFIENLNRSERNRIEIRNALECYQLES